MATVNYATILSESPNQLRYVSQTHSFQVLGNPQQSNLPLATLLAANAHTNVMSMSQTLVDIEPNTRCKKQFYGMQGNTPALPSYSWSQNVTTGMYQPANNEIAFSTNSTEKLRILSTGNVGIGTTNPSTTLYANGTAYVSSIITPSTSVGQLATPTTRFNTTNVEVNGNGIRQLTTAYNTTPVFLIQSDSKIGIGTTTPLSFLHIQSSGSSNLSGITLYNPNTSGQQDAPILLKVTNPSGTAYTSYEVGTTGWSTGIENNTFKIKNVSQFHGANAIVNSPLLVSSTGNVGMGISAPVSKLHVVGDMTLDGTLKIRKFGFEAGWDLQYINNEYLLTSIAQRSIYIQNRLEVTDNIRTNKIYISGNNMNANTGEVAFEVANGDSLFRRDVDVIGLLTVESGIAQPSSDARLKTDIKPIENALEKVASLRGVTYNWKVPELHKSKSGVGFIAQEMGQVFPNAVVRGSYGPEEAHLLEGDRNCLSYTISSEFYAYLVESIKELKARVETLESALAANSASPNTDSSSS